MGFFYAYDDLLGSREPEWLQGALNFLIGLFQMIGLAANIAKSKTILCQPEEIRLGIPEEALGRRSIGKVATYRERPRRKIQRPDCIVEMTEGSITANRQ